MQHDIQIKEHWWTNTTNERRDSRRLIKPTYQARRPENASWTWGAKRVTRVATMFSNINQHIHQHQHVQPAIRNPQQ